MEAAAGVGPLSTEEMTVSQNSSEPHSPPQVPMDYGSVPMISYPSMLVYPDSVYSLPNSGPYPTGPAPPNGAPTMVMADPYYYYYPQQRSDGQKVAMQYPAQPMMYPSGYYPTYGTVPGSVPCCCSQMHYQQPCGDFDMQCDLQQQQQPLPLPPPAYPTTSGMSIPNIYCSDTPTARVAAKQQQLPPPPPPQQQQQQQQQSSGPRRKLSFNGSGQRPPYKDMSGGKQQQQHQQNQQNQQHQQHQQQQQQDWPKRRNGYMHNILYKTELCRDMAEKGSCPRGKTCQFAHSDAEVHDPRKHPLYKTAFCYDFKNKGYCPRGDQCFHVHEFSELKTPPVLQNLRANRKYRRHSSGMKQDSFQDTSGKDSPKLQSAGSRPGSRPQSRGQEVEVKGKFPETPYKFLLKKLSRAASDPRRQDVGAIEEKTKTLGLCDPWMMESVRGAQ